MRIQYVKPDGDGQTVELPEASARRLIASGTAVAVDGDEEGEKEAGTRAAPGTTRKAAKKAAGRTK